MLTPQGETIYKLHERLDERIQAAGVHLMAQYTGEQLEFIRDFMNKLTSHSFLKLDEEQTRESNF
ncbi:hypothetical protein [Paenibacillus sp. GbtcB18]|uniref:hypothetical protein n=1 Tax=Paenibacillus sp. GbtcB18 TaxID=2824763 RepID=UPI001C30EBBA|nr:hypothetical protein [Paenibacillus sp. GbtcB18]